MTIERVLIIDDDEAFSSSLARAFRRVRIDVRVAHNSEQALQRLRDESGFDAVLVDLRIGQENGLMLLTALRELTGKARIVMLTGFASIATAVEAMKRGADDYLVKPIGFDDLLAALQEHADDAEETELPEGEPLSLRQMAWEHIQHVLAEHGGNVSAAARALGVHRRTLQRKLAKVPRSS